MRRRARGLSTESRAGLQRAIVHLSVALSVCTLLFLARLYIIVLAVNAPALQVCLRASAAEGEGEGGRGGEGGRPSQTQRLCAQAMRCPPGLSMTLCMLLSVYLPELVPCGCMVVLMWEGGDGAMSAADAVVAVGVSPGRSRGLGSSVREHVPLLRCACGRAGVRSLAFGAVATPTPPPPSPPVRRDARPSRNADSGVDAASMMLYVRRVCIA